METREIILWVFFGVVFISTLIVTLFRADQQISLRILFLRYEGSLVALWPLAVIAFAITMGIAQSRM